MAQSTASSTSGVATQPKLLYSFDAVMSKVNDSNGKFMAWKMTISRSSFPASALKNGETLTASLDPVKYSNSFEQYGRLLNLSTLPSDLYKYTVTASSDSFTVTGMTETTVRVALVDLVSQSNSNTNVRLVRPPVNFRVYEKQSSTQPTTEEADVGGLVGMFGEDNGDY